MEPLAPSTLWSLFLSDSHFPIDLFEEEGHSGNGYAWDSVARVAMKAHGLDERAVRFDSEAGTFVALSGSVAVLQALGRALRALLKDEVALRAAIRSVPADDWDD